MFKIGLNTPNAEQHPWIEYPGVISGCEVYKGDGLELCIAPGRLSFTNGFSAKVTHPIEGKLRVVPPAGFNRLDYLVCRVREGSLDFILEQGNETNNSRHHNPRIMNDGILLAKVYVVYPCLGNESVFVYNIMPVKGEVSSFSFRPFDVPDGVKTSFRLSLPIKAEFGTRISVAGVPQDQFEDYTISDWMSPWGEYLSQINFDEAPGEGAEILAKVYTGKVRLIA